MRVLLLGGGGREHAFAYCISQSPQCEKLFIAPGNGGTSQCGENVHLNPTDFGALEKFCLEKKIDMVVVGPEDPLVKGIYDYFISSESIKHIPVIGPSKAGAKMEGSKDFAKAFMVRHKIPTAAYRSFDINNVEAGASYIRSQQAPIVLKADGLAAGKGVLICETIDDAEEQFNDMLTNARFGAASSKVVVEQFLNGVEVSVFVLTDGKNYLLLPTAKDYKRIGEKDSGLNTGGMGAVSPVPYADAEFMRKVEDQVIKPTIAGLQKENLVYKGFIYFGLIKVGNDPWVIEYNCRMGDPETEVVLPRLESDILDLFSGVANGNLNTKQIKVTKKAAVTIVIASGGYPDRFEKGKEISGLDKVKDSLVFHAGTIEVMGKILTSGGRVLAVTSLGKDIPEALSISNKNAKLISFDRKYFRKDIGWEFI